MSRICFLAQFPILPNSGGVQRVTFALASELELQGFEVLFLSIGSKKRTDSNDKRQHFIGKGKEGLGPKLLNWLLENNCQILINQAGIYPFVIDSVRFIKSKVDLKVFTVHHNCLKCLHDRYPEIIMSNYPLLKKVDYSIVWRFMKKVMYYRFKRQFKKAIMVSDNLVMLSKSFADELKSFYKIDSNKVTFIPNPAPFRVDDNFLINKENRFLYVGRIKVNQKRVDKLMNIFTKLHDQLPDWHFDIVGSGDATAYLSKEIALRKLNRVHLVGHANPIPYLEKAKIFTLTSDFEGFGMVLIEAQTYKVVPIAFRCFSSIDEIVPHGTGFVIENMDENVFIQKALLLANNNSLLESMANKAFKNIDNFSLAKIGRMWINLFNNLPIHNE